MKIYFIVTAVYVTVILSIGCIFNHVGYGGYISKKTEEKYLRNLSRFEMISDHHFYIHSDTLTDICKTSQSSADPFHKWYIMGGVGLIKPNSALSTKLDSIADTYIEPNNKFK